MISHGWPVSLLLLLSFLLTGCAKNNTTRWTSLPVEIYSDTSIVGTKEAQSDLQDAMDYWESRAGKKLFVYKGVWDNSKLPYTGTPSNPGTITGNVIFFQNPWPASSNIIGQTVVTSFEEKIEHAMIMINPGALFCTGDCEGQYFANSARKNLAHELGHFLGLKHHDDVNNVMYPVLQPGGSLNGVSVDETALQELLN